MMRFTSAEELADWMNEMDITRSMPVMRYNDGLRAGLFGSDDNQWHEAVLDYVHGGPDDWFFTGEWQVTVTGDEGVWIVESHSEMSRAVAGCRLYTGWFDEVVVSPAWETVE